MGSLGLSVTQQGRHRTFVQEKNKPDVAESNRHNWGQIGNKVLKKNWMVLLVEC